MNSHRGGGTIRSIVSVFIFLYRIQENWIVFKCRLCTQCDSLKILKNAAVSAQENGEGFALKRNKCSLHCSGRGDGRWQWEHRQERTVPVHWSLLSQLAAGRLSCWEPEAGGEWRILHSQQFACL